MGLGQGWRSTWAQSVYFARNKHGSGTIVDHRDRLSMSMGMRLGTGLLVAFILEPIVFSLSEICHRLLSWHPCEVQRCLMESKLLNE